MAALPRERYYVGYDGSFEYDYASIDTDAGRPTSASEKRRENFINLIRLVSGNAQTPVSISYMAGGNTIKAMDKVVLAQASDYFSRNMTFTVEHVKALMFYTIYVGDMELITISVGPLYTVKTVVVKEGDSLDISVQPLPDVTGSMLWLRYRIPSSANYQKIANAIIAYARNYNYLYPPETIASEEIGHFRLEKFDLFQHVEGVDPDVMAVYGSRFFFGSTDPRQVSTVDVEEFLRINDYDPDQPKHWVWQCLERMGSPGGETGREIMQIKVLIALNAMFGIPGEQEYEVLPSYYSTFDLTLSKPTGAFTIIGYQLGRLSRNANYNGKYDTQDYSAFQGFDEQYMWTLRNITQVTCLEDRRVIRRPFAYNVALPDELYQDWPYSPEPSTFTVKKDEAEPEVTQLGMFRLRTEGSDEQPSVTLLQRQEHHPKLHSSDSAIYAWGLMHDHPLIDQNIDIYPIPFHIANHKDLVNAKDGGTMGIAFVEYEDLFQPLLSPFQLIITPISKTIMGTLDEGLVIDFSSHFATPKLPKDGILRWNFNNGQSVVSLDKYEGRLIVNFPTATEEQAGLYQLEVKIPSQGEFLADVHEVLQVGVDFELRCVRCDQVYSAQLNRHGKCRFHARHPDQIATAYEHSGFSIIEYMQGHPEEVSRCYNDWLQEQFRISGKSIAEDEKAKVIAQLMNPTNVSSSTIYRYLPLKDALSAIVSQSRDQAVVEDCRTILMNLSYLEPWLRRIGYRGANPHFVLEEFVGNMSLAQYESLPVTAPADKKWLKNLLKSIKPDPTLALERFDCKNPTHAEPVYTGKIPNNPNIHSGIIDWSNGKGDGPRWACCLQRPQIKGCYVGKHSSVTTLPDLSDWMHNSPRRGTEFIFDPNTSEHAFQAIRKAYAENHFTEGIRLEAAFNRIHGGYFTLGFTFLDPADLRNRDLLLIIITEPDLYEDELVELLERVNLDASFGIWGMKRSLQLDYTVPTSGDLTPRTPGLPDSTRIARVFQLMDLFRQIRAITSEDPQMQRLKREKSLREWTHSGVVSTEVDLQEFAPDVIAAKRLIESTILSYNRTVAANDKLFADLRKEAAALGALAEEIDNDPQLSPAKKEELKLSLDLTEVDAELARASVTILSTTAEVGIIEQQRAWVEELITEMVNGKHSYAPNEVLALTQDLVHDIRQTGGVPLPVPKKIVSEIALEHANAEFTDLLKKLQETRTRATAQRQKIQTTALGRYAELGPYLVQFFAAGKKMFAERTIAYETNGTLPLLRSHAKELRKLNLSAMGRLLDKIDAGEFRLQITEVDLLNRLLSLIYPSASDRTLRIELRQALLNQQWASVGDTKYDTLLETLKDQIADPTRVLNRIFSKTDGEELEDAFRNSASLNELIPIIKDYFDFPEDKEAATWTEKITTLWTNKETSFQLDKAGVLLSNPVLTVPGTLQRDLFLGQPDFDWTLSFGHEQTLELLNLYASLQKNGPEAHPGIYQKIYDVFVPASERNTLVAQFQALDANLGIVKELKSTINGIRSLIDEPEKVTFQRAVKTIREFITVQGGDKVFGALSAKLAEITPGEYDINSKLNDVLATLEKKQGRATLLTPFWTFLERVVGQLPSKPIDFTTDQAKEMIQILNRWFATSIDGASILIARLKDVTVIPPISFNEALHPVDLSTVRRLLKDYQVEVLKDLSFTHTGNWIVREDVNWTTPEIRQSLRESAIPLYDATKFQTELLDKMGRFLTLLLSGSFDAFDYLENWLSDRADFLRSRRDVVTSSTETALVIEGRVKRIVDTLRETFTELRLLYPKTAAFRKSLISLIFGVFDQIYTRTSTGEIRAWQFIHWQDPPVAKRTNWPADSSTSAILHAYLDVRVGGGDPVPFDEDILADDSAAAELAHYETSVIQRISSAGFSEVKETIEKAASLRDLGLTYSEIQTAQRDPDAFFDPLRHFIMAVVLLHETGTKLALNPVWENAFKPWFLTSQNRGETLKKIWDETLETIEKIEDILDGMSAELVPIQQVLQEFRNSSPLKSSLLAAIGNPLMLRPLILADTRPSNAGNLSILENWDAVLSYPLLAHPDRFAEINVSNFTVKVFRFLAIAISASQRDENDRYRNERIGTYLREVCEIENKPGLAQTTRQIPDVLALFVHSFDFAVLPKTELAPEVGSLLDLYKKNNPFASELTLRCGMLHRHGMIDHRYTPSGVASFLSGQVKTKTAHISLDISTQPRDAYGLHQLYMNLLGKRGWQIGVEVWKVISNNATDTDRTRVPVLVAHKKGGISKETAVIVKRRAVNLIDKDVVLASDPDNFRLPSEEKVYSLINSTTPFDEYHTIETIFSDHIHRQSERNETYAILEVTPSVMLLQKAYNADLQQVRAAFKVKADIYAAKAQSELKEMEKQFAEEEKVQVITEGNAEAEAFLKDPVIVGRVAELNALIDATSPDVKAHFAGSLTWLRDSLTQDALALDIRKLIVGDAPLRDKVAEHYAVYVKDKDLSPRDAVLHRAILEYYTASFSRTGSRGDRSSLAALIFPHKEAAVRGWIKKLSELATQKEPVVTKDIRLQVFDRQLEWLHANNWPQVKATEEIQLALISEVPYAFPQTYDIFNAGKLKEIADTLSTPTSATSLDGLDAKFVPYLEQLKLVFNPAGQLEHRNGIPLPEPPKPNPEQQTGAETIIRAVLEFATVFYIHEIMVGLKIRHPLMVDLKEYLDQQLIREKIAELVKLILKSAKTTQRWQNLDILIYYTVFMDEITKAFTPEEFIQSWFSTENFKKEFHPPLQKFFLSLVQAPFVLSDDLRSSLRDAALAKPDVALLRYTIAQKTIRDVWAPPFLNFFSEKLSAIYGEQFYSILPEYEHFHKLKLALQATIRDEEKGGWRVEEVTERGLVYRGLLRLPSYKSILARRANWTFTAWPSTWKRKWVAAPTALMIGRSGEPTSEPELAALFKLLVPTFNRNLEKIESNPAYRNSSQMGDQVKYLFDLDSVLFISNEKDHTLTREQTNILAQLDLEGVPLLPLVTMDIYASPGETTKDVQLLSQIAKWETVNGVKIYSSRYADLAFDKLRQRSQFRELSQPDPEMIKELRDLLVQEYQKLGLFTGLPQAHYQRMFHPVKGIKGASLANLRLEYYFWIGSAPDNKLKKVELEAALDKIYAARQSNPEPWMRPAAAPEGLYGATAKQLSDGLNALNEYAAQLTTKDAKDRPLTFFVEDDIVKSKDLAKPKYQQDLQKFFLTYALTPYLSTLTAPNIAQSIIGDFMLAFLSFPIYEQDLPAALQTVTSAPNFEAAGARRIRGTKDIRLTGVEAAKTPSQEADLIPTAEYPTNPVGLHLYIVVKQNADKEKEDMVGWALWDTSSQDFGIKFGEEFASLKGLAAVPTSSSAELVYLYTRLSLPEDKAIAGLGNALMCQGLLDARWINKKSSFITEATQGVSVLPGRKTDDEITRDLVGGVPRVYFPVKGNLVTFYGKFGFKMTFPDKNTVIPGLTRPTDLINAWRSNPRLKYKIMNSPSDELKYGLNDDFLFYERIANVLTVGGPVREGKPAEFYKLIEFQNLEKRSMEATGVGPEGAIVKNVSRFDVGKSNPGEEPVREFVPYPDTEQEWYPSGVSAANPAYTQALLLLPDLETLLQGKSPGDLLSTEPTGPYRAPRLQTPMDWKTAALIFKMQYLGQRQFE